MKRVLRNGVWRLVAGAHERRLIEAARRRWGELHLLTEGMASGGSQILREAKQACESMRWYADNAQAYVEKLRRRVATERGVSEALLLVDSIPLRDVSERGLSIFRESMEDAIVFHGDDLKKTTEMREATSSGSLGGLLRKGPQSPMEMLADEAEKSLCLRAGRGDVDAKKRLAIMMAGRVLRQRYATNANLMASAEAGGDPSPAARLDGLEPESALDRRQDDAVNMLDDNTAGDDDMPLELTDESEDGEQDSHAGPDEIRGGLKSLLGELADLVQDEEDPEIKKELESAVAAVHKALMLLDGGGDSEEAEGSDSEPTYAAEDEEEVALQDVPLAPRRR